MKKSLLILVAASLTLGSCVSKKKYTAIQLSNETLHGKLDEANRALSDCNAKNANMQTSVDHLKEQVSEMSVTNQALLNNVGNMATLSTQEAANLEKSLENIKEKDLQIRSMQDALTKKGLRDAGAWSSA
jgi:chemotaxis protein MotB